MQNDEEFLDVILYSSIEPPKLFLLCMISLKLSHLPPKDGSAQSIHLFIYFFSYNKTN